MSNDTADYRGLRIAFAGTPDFAAAHLQALLLAGANIIAVYTQPDRPAGRGKKLTSGPVKQLAVDHKLPLFQPSTLRDSVAQDDFAALGADILIVVAYGLIIPQAVLDIPRYGCINVHASLLPRWRGAAPIQRAIEAGDPETGITIMQMDAGLDTGDMLLKVACPITLEDTGGSLQDKLAGMGPVALLDVLNSIAKGAVQGEKQDGSLSCYARKISKEEALVDWGQDSDLIARKIRAFNPFPVAFSALGDITLRIWDGHALPATRAELPGTIVHCDRNGLEIACGAGVLLVTQAQLPGRKPMPITEIVRGNPDLFTPGKRLGGHAE